MVRVSEFDKVFNDAQRQGRISFYLTGRGEEACSVASAAALSDTDFILPQYRELGAAFWRGFTFEDTANQLCANGLDPAKGRQLPLHIGDKNKYFFYVKSTLGTQCPHAVGAAQARPATSSAATATSSATATAATATSSAVTTSTATTSTATSTAPAAQALKLMGRRSVALTYFGEGCASEGDIPSALNIAAVHGTPTIFFCRNNGYAISTSVRDQYSGDGVAPRGVAFGMPAIRVDGNDPFAVYAAVRRARQIAVEEGKPSIIEAADEGTEPSPSPYSPSPCLRLALALHPHPAPHQAMTYRIGAHSTSDDDSKSRSWLKVPSAVSAHSGRLGFTVAAKMRLWPPSTTRYRNPHSPEPGWDSERAYWESRSPIIRFGRYLQAQGWYDGQQEEELRKQARKDAIRSLNAAQKVGKPHTKHLFSDVYDEVPWHLMEQEQALLKHMQKYPASYTEYLSGNAEELDRVGAAGAGEA